MDHIQEYDHGKIKRKIIDEDINMEQLYPTTKSVDKFIKSIIHTFAILFHS